MVSSSIFSLAGIETVLCFVKTSGLQARRRSGFHARWSIERAMLVTSRAVAIHCVEMLPRSKENSATACVVEGRLEAVKLATGLVMCANHFCGSTSNSGVCPDVRYHDSFGCPGGQNLHIMSSKTPHIR